MICQNCNKNQATVRYTQIINGAKTEMNLCEKCSKELGISTYNFNMPIDFSNFLSDFIDEYSMEPIVKVLKCNNCNMSYDDFLNLGKFGCSECYTQFSNKIDSVLKKIQGANRYTGERRLDSKKIEKIEFKSNKKNEDTKEREIDKLKKELKLKIEEEAYEEAAKIRDKIKELEKGE